MADFSGVRLNKKYYKYGRELYHVRGVLPEDNFGCTMVVVRTWYRRKQRWHYACEPLWVFEGPECVVKVFRKKRDQPVIHRR